MKKLLLALALLIPVLCNAQSTQADVTKVTDNARFVIVQSTIAVKLTFKLDTYSGFVYLLVADNDSKYSWQLMHIEGIPKADTYNLNTRNYSLFVSPLGVRYTFLMNTNTGATWMLKEDTETKAMFFKLMDGE